MARQAPNFFCILPKEMSNAECFKLAKRVYDEAHCNIFDGTTFQEFYSTVFLPNTEFSKIMILTYGGQITGYVSFHVYKVPLVEKDIYVVMTEMGTNKCVKHPFEFLSKEILKYTLQNLDKEVYLIDTAITPYIYQKCCNKFNEIYPRFGTKIPDKVFTILDQVSKHFHWQLNNNHGALVRSLQWKIKADYEIQHYQRCVEDNDINFYKKLVPNYQAGEGLVIAVPLSLTNSIKTATKVLYTAVQREAEETLESLRHAW